LIYPYRTAAEELGISQPGFRKCIDRLIALGFLDIIPPASNEESAVVGRFNPATVYSISDRFKLWGTPGFVAASRPHDQRHVGFQGKAQVANGGVKKTPTTWQNIECVTTGTHEGGLADSEVELDGKSNEREELPARREQKRCTTPVTQGNGALHNPSYAALHNHGYAGSGETA
jgi:hypothetical protein